MVRPPAATAASQPSATTAAAASVSVHNAPMNAAAAAPNPNPNLVSFAGPFRPLGAPPPGPYTAPVNYMLWPPVFPAVMPPGSFPRLGVYWPPLPGACVPYPGTPFPTFEGPRYTTPYPMAYQGPPGFPPSHMPPFGVCSPQCPAAIPGIGGPVARPPTPTATPAEKPHFTVYVGKIAPTVDNDFVLSLLQVCGPVKSWKRAEIAVDGTSRGFGFCEFECAEGSLRAMRLLSKLSIDGQELVLNINKATREYLEKVDEKKTTKEKVKEAEAEAEGRDGMVSLAENENDSSRTVPNVTRETGDGGQKSIRVNIKRCWNVTEENSDVDKDAMWKICSMIEERMKSKLPGPPTSPAQISAGKSGDEDTKKRRQSSAVKERKSRRVCEKEEELEEGEFSKAEMEAMGLQHWKDREVAAAVKSSLQIDVASSMHVSMEQGSTVEDERKSQHRARDGFHKKNDEEMSIIPGLVSDKQNSSARVGPFGLIGSRKLTFVPAVFDEEDNNDTVEKRMQPLMPIDYSTEELQSVQGNSSTEPPNFVATAEFAKHISVSNSRVERSEGKDRSGRRSDKSRASESDTEQNEKYGARVVNERRKDIHDQEKDRQGTSKSEDKKTLDAKQLLATVPKTKEELFACDVNWAIYDKHKLHERMRPWISNRATEYFGEEVAEFVDFVVASTKEHVEAPRMMQLLESLLDDCAENFVLSMWRKLIFEIRRVEQDEHED